MLLLLSSISSLKFFSTLPLHYWHYWLLSRNVTWEKALLVPWLQRRRKRKRKRKRLSTRDVMKLLPPYSTWALFFLESSKIIMLNKNTDIIFLVSAAIRNTCRCIDVFVLRSPVAGSPSADAAWPGCSLWSPGRPVAGTPQRGSGCRSRWCWCTGISGRWHSPGERRLEGREFIHLRFVSHLHCFFFLFFLFRIYIKMYVLLAT